MSHQQEHTLRCSFQSYRRSSSGTPECRDSYLRELSPDLQKYSLSVETDLLEFPPIIIDQVSISQFDDKDHSIGYPCGSSTARVLYDNITTTVSNYNSDLDNLVLRSPWSSPVTINPTIPQNASATPTSHSTSSPLYHIQQDQTGASLCHQQRPVQIPRAPRSRCEICQRSFQSEQLVE